MNTNLVTGVVFAIIIFDLFYFYTYVDDKRYNLSRLFKLSKQFLQHFQSVLQGKSINFSPDELKSRCCQHYFGQHLKARFERSGSSDNQYSTQREQVQNPDETVIYVKKIGDDIYTARGYISFKTAQEKIFKQFGLLLVDQKPIIPKLIYEIQPKCGRESFIYSDWLEKSEDYNESAVPPTEIPQHLKSNYTLGGHIHLDIVYKDDRSGFRNATWDMVEDFVKRPIEFFHTRIENYYKDGEAMFNAMKRYNLTGMHGAVVGSLTPWVESFALKNGAQKVTTIEYMKIDVVGTKRVKYLHPLQLAKNATRYLGKFDFAASYSSLEHSGLGRYGDLPDPIGDIREMQKIRCLIKEGGIFFFGVPMGPDALQWNLHRIYGRIRLAIMFAGFELLDTFEGQNPKPIEIRAEHFGPNAPLFSFASQPVFVLRKL